MSSIDGYWEALQRLRDGKPVRVPQGSVINKDTVALEAGRARGAIKKSRASFADLITAIGEEAGKQRGNHSETPLGSKGKQAVNKDYRELYHESLNRELMLFERVAQLEREVESLRNVVPFKK